MNKIFKNRKSLILLSAAILIIIIITTAVIILPIQKSSNTTDNKTSSENQSTSIPKGSDIDDGGTEAILNNRPEQNIKTYPLSNEFSAPEYQKKVYKDEETDSEMCYSLFLPENYSESKKYPVLLLMHGLTGEGTNYVNATNHFAALYQTNGDIIKSAIIVIPQAPDAIGYWPINKEGNDQKGWGAVAMRLLLDIEKTYSCDTNRIYVAGLSMGGHGTWNLLEAYGDHFAAGVPICGWGNPLNARKLKNIPIWAYHGDQDPTVPVLGSRSMYEMIRSAGGTKIHYTELPGVKHEAWIYAYQSRELFSWLFSQNKETNPNSDYDIIPLLTVKDPDGNIIISERDTTYISLTTIEEQDCLELSLTEKAAQKLTDAYKNSNGQTFTVYYGNIKIMTFTPTGGQVEKSFFIPQVFDSYNYYEYADKLTASAANEISR